MLLIALLSLLIPFQTSLPDAQPSYEREGDRVEQEFRAYQEKLSAFFTLVRGLVDQQPVNVQLPRLQDTAPAAVLYGYGAVPRIVDAAPAGSAPYVDSFSYR